MKMFRTRCWAVLAALLLVVVGCSPTPMRLDRLPEVGVESSFKPVAPEQWHLANGMTVLYLRDRELPLVRGNLFLAGGALWEPADKPGVITAIGDQMRQGGAGARSADELDRALEVLSASIGSSFGNEYGNVSFSCLVSDLDEVFEMFADVVRRPRFEGGRLALWKGQALESIRRRSDDAGTVAGITFNQLLYGASPYARYLTQAEVQRISRADLTAEHRRAVRPDHSILFITGDVDRARVEELITRHLGDWVMAGLPRPVPPPVDAAPRPGVYFVELPFVQATIYLGHLSVPRLTPDYPAIDGFNEIFGAGGFGSLLMRKIRAELGLAYGIYGSIVPGPVRGRNVVAVQTKGESAGQALVETLNLLVGMQLEPVEAERIAEMQRSIRNSFVFKFDAPDDVLTRRASQMFLGYPTDYDETYLPRIGAVTPEDVRAVAERRWSLAEMVVTVVGDQRAYEALTAAAAAPSWPLPSRTVTRIEFDEVPRLPPTTP